MRKEVSEVVRRRLRSHRYLVSRTLVHPPPPNVTYHDDLSNYPSGTHDVIPLHTSDTAAFFKKKTDHERGKSFYPPRPPINAP